MKLGVVINETWSFFQEVYNHFAEHHQVTLFKHERKRSPVFEERIERYRFDHNLRTFLANKDVVFFEWSSELLAAATRLPKTCGIVTRLHRYEMYQWVDQIQWDAVDRLILVSQAKEREFLKRFPSQAGKTVVIPEAIDLKKFQHQPKTFGGNLGILCHLSPRKRVYELILAFSELCALRDDLHLHIGGGPHPKFRDYAFALESLVDRLKLQDKVTFYGPVKAPQAWYRKIDIFISNSYSEGLQVSPMEAIASGCYCLSHDWDGANELLPGDDLYLTDQQLVRKVLQYAELTEDEKNQRQAWQRERVCSQFDLDQIKIQIRQQVEAVAAAGPKGSLA